VETEIGDADNLNYKEIAISFQLFSERNKMSMVRQAHYTNNRNEETNTFKFTSTTNMPSSFLFNAINAICKV